MTSLTIERAKAALKNAFVGDALAMPVHWFYNPADIYKTFPLERKKEEGSGKHLWPQRGTSF